MAPIMYPPPSSRASRLADNESVSELRPIGMSGRLTPPARIETERLVLRRVEQTDAPTIFERWGSDADVTRYLSWETHDVVDHAVGYVRYALQAWEMGSEFVWMIEDEAGELLGGISFGVIGHRANFGYVLSKKAWGNGYAVEALSGLVGWLEEQASFRRLEAYCSTENLASRRVLEKAGFTHEGTLRNWMVFPNLGDEPRDVDMFSRVR